MTGRDRGRVCRAVGTAIWLGVGAALPLALPASAEAQDLTVRVASHVPAFLAFHEEYEAFLEARAARKEAADPTEEREAAEAADPTEEREATEATDPAEERAPGAEEGDPADVRWSLWVEHGAHPALPDEESDREALRARLDAVYDRYARALPRIREAAEGFAPAPQPLLRGVARTLRLDRPLEVELAVYVGLFDERPRYVHGADGPRVLFPVEVQPAARDRRTELIHLLSEAVHARLSGRSADLPPTVAERLLSRGLGLRAHEALSPGLPTERYLGRSLDWLLELEARDARLLEAVRPRLGRRTAAAPAGLVAGRGPTGLEGELDYIAWRLIGHLVLHQGWTIDRLARVPAAEVPGLLAAAVDEARQR